MTTDVWTTRAADPLTFHYHEGSFAHENVDALVERYQKALDDVCLFLDVQRSSLGPIGVYLCEVLPPDPDESQGSITRLDLDQATIWTVVTSESMGAYPEFELTLLVPALPGARPPGGEVLGRWAGRLPRRTGRRELLR